MNENGQQQVYTYVQYGSQVGEVLCNFIYRNAQGTLQLDHAHCFSSYLITVCWEKIFSQISSWLAVGFIFGLRTVLR